MDACPAGSASAADTINLPAGTYTLTRAGSGEDQASTGDLDLAGDLVLSGAGANTTAIDAAGLDCVLHVLSGTVEVRAVTLRGGNLTNAAGGGIRQDGGALTLRYVAVRDNTTALDGGGLTACTGCTLTVVGATISDNASGDDGGGLYVSGATVRIANSTLSGNAADDNGGGLYTSTSSGAVWLNNVTVSGNTADADASEAGNGGGITRSAGTITLRHTLVAGNADASAGTKHPDCTRTVASDGHNLVGNNTGCTLTPTTGDQVGTGPSPIDPLLGAIADNGGPTLTHALLSGSPAIDAGDPAGCVDSLGSPLAADQRGQPRPADGDGNGSAVCDLGAHEVVPPPTPTPTPTASLTPSPTGTPTATPTDTPTATPTPVPGGAVTITYTYDPLSRLTGADYSTGEYFHYAYDAVGDRLTETTCVGLGCTPATTSYAYDDASRLETRDGQAVYTWDDNGSLLSDGVSAYTYDSANRLTGVTQGSTTYAFAYNGLGDRLRQTDDWQTNVGVASSPTPLRAALERVSETSSRFSDLMALSS